jgi:hypothetical protein
MGADTLSTAQMRSCVIVPAHHADSTGYTPPGAGRLASTIKKTRQSSHPYMVWGQSSSSGGGNPSSG